VVGVGAMIDHSNEKITYAFMDRVFIMFNVWIEKYSLKRVWNSMKNSKNYVKKH
jgi:hypothetical protein